MFGSDGKNMVSDTIESAVSITSVTILGGEVAE